MNYVLIDFENVQPSNLEVLKLHPFKVLVFVGANQPKVPFDLACAMQPLGDAVQYIKISGSGKNALDFHIAHYVGELSAKESSAYFHIISGDTGFDALIQHLKKRGINVQRERDLSKISVVQMSTAPSTDDKVATIVKNLAGLGQSRPRKVKTLSNTINSLFSEKISKQQVSSIVKKLEEINYIKVSNGDVLYLQ